MKKKDKQLRSSSYMQDNRKESQATKFIRISDGEWLKWRYNGFTKCVIIYLPKRMAYSEIRERIRKAFGDSD